ncbi:MAG TPA: CinA family protein, partial [Anaerolineae bacterium]|nr:CinA family protein [Anaerolineae bacterium]
MDEAERLGELLQARGWRLAVAESCTGGLLGHLITEIPGSSAYFLGGVLVYADAMKQRLLGVRAESLQRWGAVSAQVALEMASGVQ